MSFVSSTNSFPLTSLFDARCGTTILALSREEMESCARTSAVVSAVTVCIIGAIVLAFMTFGQKQQVAWEWKVGTAVVTLAIAAGGYFLAPVLAMRRWTAMEDSVQARATAVGKSPEAVRAEMIQEQAQQSNFQSIASAISGVGADLELNQLKK